MKNYRYKKRYVDIKNLNTTIINFGFVNLSTNNDQIWNLDVPLEFVQDIKLNLSNKDEIFKYKDGILNFYVNLSFNNLIISLFDFSLESSSFIKYKENYDFYKFVYEIHSLIPSHFLVIKEEYAHEVYFKLLNNKLITLVNLYSDIRQTVEQYLRINYNIANLVDYKLLSPPLTEDILNLFGENYIFY